MRTEVLLCLFIFASIWSGCTFDKADFPEGISYCDTADVSFSNDLIPLFESSCATMQGPGTGCHDAWIFEHNNVKVYAENGTLEKVVAVEKRMPPPDNSFDIPPLTNIEIEMITCWIKQGADNN